MQKSWDTFPYISLQILYLADPAPSPPLCIIGDRRRRPAQAVTTDHHVSLAVRAVCIPPFHLSPRCAYTPFSPRRAYRNLSTRTRLMIGGGIIAYGTLGLFVSDKAEQAFGFAPTEEDRRRLKEAIPKIHTIEREK